MSSATRQLRATTGSSASDRGYGRTRRLHHATPRHHPPPHEPLRGRRRDRREPSTPPTSRSTTSRAASRRRRRQLQRAYAEIGNTTFREHLTAVRMERAAELLRSRGADRPRGRPPRRLPPARAVRQGLPPPPRRLAVGVPLARGRSGRRRRPRMAPARERRRSLRRQRRNVPRCALSRTTHRMPPAWPEESTPRARSATPARRPADDRRRRRSPPRSASPLGLVDRLVPDAGVRRRPSTIDTLWDVLLIVSVPVFVLVTTVVLLLGRRVPHAPGRGEPRRPADPRQHAARGHLDRDPGDPASSASCTYAYVVLRDIEKAPGRRGNERRSSPSPASSSPGRFDYARGRQEPFTHGAALPARRPVGEVRRPVQGRHPRLLGPGLPDEDRRRPGHHHAATASRRPSSARYPIVCAELCGLGHAFMRQTAPRPRPARRSTPGSQKMTAPGAAAGGGGRRRRRPDAKTLFTDGKTAHRRRRPAAPATRSPTPARPATIGPDLDKVLKGKDAAFIKRVDRRPRQATIAQGFHASIMPPNFGEYAVAGADRRRWSSTSSDERRGHS